MVFLEAVFIFSGRYYRILHSAAGHCLCYGRTVLPVCIYYDCVYNCKKADIRGSDFGMAFPGVYYSALQRRAAILCGHCGAVFVQDLHGSKKEADLSCEGRNLTDLKCAETVRKRGKNGTKEGQVGQYCDSGV